MVRIPILKSIFHISPFESWGMEFNEDLRHKRKRETRNPKRETREAKPEIEYTRWP